MAPKERRKHDGLFQVLLGGDYLQLVADAELYPDKYLPEVLNLLGQLQGGRRTLADLSEWELRLLDMAVLDFASAPQKNGQKPTAVKTPPAPKVEKPKGPEEEPTEKVAEPVDQLTTNWWVTDSGSR